jgi:hypothetical protein
MEQHPTLPPPPPAPKRRSRLRRSAPWILTAVAVLALIGALTDTDDTDQPGSAPVAAQAASTDPEAPATAPEPEPTPEPTTAPAPVTTAEPVTTPAPTTTAAPVDDDELIARLSAEWAWRDMSTADRYIICDGYRTLGVELTRMFIPDDMDPVAAASGMVPGESATGRLPPPRRRASRRADPTDRSCCLAAWDLCLG